MNLTKTSSQILTSENQTYTVYPQLNNKDKQEIKSWNNPQNIVCAQASAEQDNKIRIINDGEREREREEQDN